MNIFEKIIGVIFPKQCVGCGLRGFLICDVCKSRIPSASNPMYEFITSVFSYSDPSVRRMVHLMKYRSGRYVAKFFAPYMLSSLSEFVGEEKLFIGNAPILLVPVPLSKSRMKMRGYNQSELLIKEIIKIDNTKRFLLEKKLITKIKDTTPQVLMKNKSERLLNQTNCFAVMSHKKTKYETIILVDDVTTTGATLVAVRELLRKDGFKKVYALTAAH